jgi:REP element-mobilizing transposase RayT
MSDSLCAVHIHLVFSTKDRRPLIPVELQPRLWSYLHGISQNLRCRALEIGGMPDHVHLLVEISPVISIAALAQKLKANSSRWMRETTSRPFSWQTGYAAFGVSASQVSTVRNYIRNQQKHHTRRNLDAEFDLLLRRYGIVVPSLRDSNR